MNFYELLLNRGQPSGEGMTHFERLFAAKLAGGGGEIKELEGVPPLLFKANGEPLIDWSIYGNTVQSGTPTPQNPVMPNGCGERTNNLFDKNGEILTGSGAVINITETGIKTIVQSQGNNRYSTIKLDNELLGKTITISSTITQSANNKGQIRLYYVNGRYATSLIASITTVGQTGHISTTYTMPSSIPSGSDSIAIVLSADKDGDGEVGDYVEYADLMIVEGSTPPTSFIPYGFKLDIKSANTTTPVYLGEVQTVRKIIKYEFTGEENWIRESGNTYALEGVKQTATGYENALCTHYVLAKSYNTLTGTDGTFSVSRRPSLFIHDENFTTVAQLKTYLATQYAAGTPITVWYVLATPTTAVVNEPLQKIGDYADSLTATQAGVEIPTIKGNNTLDIDTTVKPSKVYIKYKD